MIAESRALPPDLPSDALETADALVTGSNTADVIDRRLLRLLRSHSLMPAFALGFRTQVFAMSDGQIFRSDIWCLKTAVIARIAFIFLPLCKRKCKIDNIEFS